MVCAKQAAFAGTIVGCGDNLGLARLPEKIKQNMIRDINLFMKG